LRSFARSSRIALERTEAVEFVVAPGNGRVLEPSSSVVSHASRTVRERRSDARAGRRNSLTLLTAGFTL
jgi:hypothetical protein